MKFQNSLHQDRRVFRGHQSGNLCRISETSITIAQGLGRAQQHQGVRHHETQNEVFVCGVVAPCVALPERPGRGVAVRLALADTITEGILYIQ